MSIAALIISALAFGLGRLDKHNERKASASAFDPVIDFDLTRGGWPGNFNYELKISNPGKVSAQLLSLSCDEHAELKPDEADLMADGSVNYRGLRIAPGQSEIVSGELDVEMSDVRPVGIVVKLRINDAVTREKVIKLTRAT